MYPFPAMPTSEHISVAGSGSTSAFGHASTAAPTSNATDALPTTSRHHHHHESRANWLQLYLGAPGTLLGASLGLLLAYVLTMDDIKASLKYWDASSDRLAQKAINQLGVLYLRALTCVVYPQAFVNIVLVAATITAQPSPRLGKAGWRVLWLSFVTTLLVVGQGVALGVYLLPRFQGSTYYFRRPKALLKCPSPASTFLQYINATSHTLHCAPYTGSMEGKLAFYVGDVGRRSIEIDPTVNRFRTLESSSLPELVQVLLTSTSFTNAINVNLVHLVLGAFSLGVATGTYTRATSTKLLDLLRELVRTFEIMTGWVVAGLPVALMSLIAGPIYMTTHNVFVASAANDLVRLTWYVMCFGVVAAVHMVAVLPLFLVLTTRGQVHPWKFLGAVKEALWYNIGTSSSRAGQTVLARNIDRAPGSAPCTISRFALDVGVTCNKSGGGLYIALSMLWMFSNAGLQVYLTPSKIVLVVVLATLGSYAVVPVRNGGVAIVMCAFAMLTGLPPPNAMNFLLIAECVLDPLCTALNAWSNAVVTRIVCFLKTS
ncbi:hypothetical protein DYB25_013387 [Aphanomyces astaci]|uniref:Amino acid transporter n=2 Tax=Aphanomyces astaci TaxID=112090 RepID=A0A397BIC3_APHAT|nr:hypothetical protein DYB36_011121 [Aphanomyces astaci]RHY27469.1 hypothetical protein DYB25_013387 [Aphanomyces astaci]